jgi:small subunit ribosomal protein S19
MTRSCWKGPFVDPSLYRKLLKLNFQKLASSKPLQIWTRNSVILPECLGLSFEVYNGKTFYPVLVKEEMIGHKFGEFSHTRKLCLYKKSKKKKS